MKLSALFAKYLYQHKVLNLPGIGVFTIDPAVVIPDATDKNFSDFVRQIQFTQKSVAAPDEAFIDFIRTETGKIRPLAESDLDSFLSDGKILLNIGKPFHLEGIGSLQKNKAGQYEFTPGEPVHVRLEHFNTEAAEEPKKRAVFTEDNTQGTGGRKLLIALGVIIGIVLVIWGGYTLYNRNANSNTAASEDNVVIPPSDTARKGMILDSVQKIIASAADSVRKSNTAGTYRFVIERTYNKARAIRRFNQIKDNLTDIKMESSADSTFFKLYFDLPATPADTTRIKDSLKIWYGRKDVFIEK